jgi:hypothetical protein
MMGDTCRNLVGKAAAWKKERNIKVSLRETVSFLKASFIIKGIESSSYTTRELLYLGKNLKQIGFEHKKWC